MDSFLSSSSLIVSRTTPATPATPSSSLPVTPRHPHRPSASLLDRVLSSSPSKRPPNQATLRSLKRKPSPFQSDNDSLYRKLIQSGIQLTPNKLSRAINHLISEKHSASQNSRMPQQQSLGLKRPSDQLDRTPRKKIAIQSAPDGSASLVVSSDPHHSSSSLLTPPTTLTLSSPLSISSKTRSNQPYARTRSAPVYHQSSLVSADLQDYGRVAIKKEALIDKLGFEAAQRAIHKARSTRPRSQQQHRPKRAQLPPSPQNASSRTNRIKKWLDSADLEDEENRSTFQCVPSLNTQTRHLLDTLTSLAESGPRKEQKIDTPASDPQSLFWSSSKLSTSQAILDRSRTPDLPNGFNSLGKGIMNDACKLMARPSTPPNQQSFFNCDSDHRLDIFGSFSHLSFSQPPPPSSMNTMLKPGCNLNQSFLSLAPSPTIVLSGSEELGGTTQNVENRCYDTKKSEASSNSSSKIQQRFGPSGNTRSRQTSNSFISRSCSKNDFSPCSPVRLSQQQSSFSRLDDDNYHRGALENLFDHPSLPPDQTLHFPWLAEIDTNRNPSHFLRNPPSSNYLLPSNSFDDHFLFDDFLAFS